MTLWSILKEPDKLSAMDWQKGSRGYIERIHKHMPNSIIANDLFLILFLL